MMNEFGLEGVECALNRGMVEATRLATHRSGRIGGCEGVGIFVRGILGGLKPCTPRSECWINSAPGRCWPIALVSGGDEFAHVTPYRPADDLSAEGVHDGS